MKLLIIDIKGKFATFKKFYSNSSVMSYYFPPRTTITGILAGIMGRERDSYHKEFSSENINFAISIRNKVKKNIQKVNYLKIESVNDLNGSNKNSVRTQVPFEFVLPVNFCEMVYYRIYCYCNDAIYSELFEKLSKFFQVYPVYLGKAGFSASVELVASNDDIIIDKKDSYEFNEIASVIPKVDNLIIDLDFKSDQILNIYEEKMPFEFIDNNNRALKEARSFVFGNGGKINAKINGFFYSLTYHDDTENIIFMEA